MSSFNNNFSLLRTIKAVDSSLNTAIVNGVKNEKDLRIAEIDELRRKVGFMSTCEAEGILSDNSYPFSYGMGCRSGSRFGLPIPFDYVLRQIGFTCESTDANPSITISIYNYPLSDNFDHPTEDVERSSTPVIDNLTISGKSLSFQQDNILPLTFGGGPGGNLIIKVISTTGLTDENTKMRITLVLTAELPLFINY